jgi:hypothetical protein
MIRLRQPREGPRETRCRLRQGKAKKSFLRGSFILTDTQTIHRFQKIRRRNPNTSKMIRRELSETPGESLNKATSVPRRASRNPMRPTSCDLRQRKARSLFSEVPRAFAQKKKRPGGRVEQMFRFWTRTRIFSTHPDDTRKGFWMLVTPWSRKFPCTSQKSRKNPKQVRFFLRKTVKKRFPKR